jgi:hypothetical protein
MPSSTPSPAAASTGGKRVKIPEELVPAEAKAEIETKTAAGCFTNGSLPAESTWRG